MGGNLGYTFWERVTHIQISAAKLLTLLFKTLLNSVITSAAWEERFHPKEHIGQNVEICGKVRSINCLE